MSEIDWMWVYENPKAAAAKIAKLQTVVMHARQKLELYREAHGGEYVGGVEYTRLIREIDEAIASS